MATEIKLGGMTVAVVLKDIKNVHLSVHPPTGRVTISAPRHMSLDTIRLNTDLAKKPLECLEYLVVHEMAHLLEPTHNERFTTLMGRHMPKWQAHRQTLNRLPVRHESRGY